MESKLEHAVGTCSDHAQHFDLIHEGIPLILGSVAIGLIIIWIRERIKRKRMKVR